MYVYECIVRDTDDSSDSMIGTLGIYMFAVGREARGRYYIQRFTLKNGHSVAFMKKLFDHNPQNICI